MNAPKEAPYASLRAPFSVLAVSPSRKEGWEVLEALGLAGKHLETTTLDAVKDTEELAVGLAVGAERAEGAFAPGVTFIANRRLVRTLLEHPRVLEPKVLAAFPMATIVVGRAWDHGYGYAVYEGGEIIRKRAFAHDELLVDEGELLDEEDSLYEDSNYGPDGELLDESVQRGCEIASQLLLRLHEGPLRAIEVDLYEGPPR